VTVCLVIAVLMIGVWGLGDSGFWLPDRAAINGSMATPFAAGPNNVRRVVPLKDALSSLNAPPLYVKAAFSNTHSPQFKPSKSWPVPLILREPILGLRPGMAGMNAGMATPLLRVGADGDCAVATMWLPEKSDPTKNPITSDPNAKVVLDISPPPSGNAGDCVVLRYKYGEPPPLKAPRQKQGPIIPQQKKAVPKQTKRDLSGQLPSQGVTRRLE
jgi:hypothetical protein